MKKRFGKELKKARLDNNKTIPEVSEATGILTDTLYKYEIGRFKISKFDGLELSSYLEIDPFIIGIELPIEDKFVARNPFAVLSLRGFSIIKLIKSIFKMIICIFKKKPKKTKKKESIIQAQLFSLSIPKTKPYMYKRIVVFLILVAMLSSIASTTVILNLSLSLIVPFGLMWYLIEKHHPRLITGLDMTKYFLFGGLLSIIVTYTIRLVTGYLDEPIIGDIVTGLVEEMAKALIIIFLLRKLKVRHILVGILIGFAVGAGFSVIETTDYGIYYFYETGHNFDMSLVIIMRSIFSLFGTDHTFWAGILGGVLVAINKTGAIKFKDLKKPTFISWYLVVALVHGTYNFLTEYSVIYVIPLSLFSLCIFMMVWNNANRQYRAYLKKENEKSQAESAFEDTEFEQIVLYD